MSTDYENSLTGCMQLQYSFGMPRQYTQLRIWKETHAILNFICSVEDRSLISVLHRMSEDKVRSLEAENRITKEQLRRFFRR